MEHTTIIAFVGLLAQGAGGGQAAQGPPPWVNIVPLVLIMVVFYFLLIRPQQKKAREHTELLKTLKAGDKVITSGGVLGVVVAVKDRTVSLRSADSKLEVLKSSVSEITERAGSNGDS